MAFGYDPPKLGMSAVGHAWTGGACSKLFGCNTKVWGGTSFNEYQDTPAITAEVQLFVSFENKIKNTFFRKKKP